MKIRWTVNVDYLPKTIPSWLRTCIRYPITFLFLALCVFIFEFYYIRNSLNANPIQSDISVLGISQLINERFSFLFAVFVLFTISFAFVWAFWFLALSHPTQMITEEELSKLSDKLQKEVQTKEEDRLKPLKIRWINEEVRPIPGSPRWVQFVAKYPFLMFLPAALLFTYAYYWNRWILEWESGETESLHLGSLKLVYNLFGKNGIVGFYVLIGVAFLWVFWIFAIGKPKR